MTCVGHDEEHPIMDFDFPIGPHHPDGAYDADQICSQFTGDTLCNAGFYDRGPVWTNRELNSLFGQPSRAELPFMYDHFDFPACDMVSENSPTIPPLNGTMINGTLLNATDGATDDGAADASSADDGGDDAPAAPVVSDDDAGSAIATGSAGASSGEDASGDDAGSAIATGTAGASTGDDGGGDDTGSAIATAAENGSHKS